MTDEQITNEKAMGLVSAQAIEIGKLRAVLAEHRVIIRKLMADRDQHVSAILAAQQALKSIDSVAAKIKENGNGAVPINEKDTPAVKAWIDNMASKIGKAQKGELEKIEPTA